MDFYDAWNNSVEDIKKQVTGVGPWTALNVAIPVVLEDEVLVIGFRPQDVEFMGHLKMPGVMRAMETEVQKRLNQAVRIQLLDGITVNDWEAYKTRQAAAEAMKEQDFQRSKRDISAARAWDDLYDALSREYQAIPNKTWPQQKAKLFEKCVELTVETLSDRVLDELGEKNLARCLERIAQYCDVPAAIVAQQVLQKAAR